MQSSSLGYGSYHPARCRHQTEDDQRHFSSKRSKWKGFGSPVGWFFFCRANKLMIEQESRWRGKGEKRRRVWIKYPSIKIIFINSHWRRRVILTDGDKRQLRFPSVRPSQVLFLFALPGDSFGREWSAELGKSISIHLSTPLPTSTSTTQSSHSNLRSTRWHFDLWQVPACDYRRPEEEKDRKTQSNVVGWNVL